MRRVAVHGGGGVVRAPRRPLADAAQRRAPAHQRVPCVVALWGGGWVLGGWAGGWAGEWVGGWGRWVGGWVDRVGGQGGWVVGGGAAVGSEAGRVEGQAGPPPASTHTDPSTHARTHTTHPHPPVNSQVRSMNAGHSSRAARPPPPSTTRRKGARWATRPRASASFNRGASSASRDPGGAPAPAREGVGGWVGWGVGGWGGVRVGWGVGGWGGGGRRVVGWVGRRVKGEQRTQ